MVDRQYVQAHTEGFADLEARIKDFSPEKMQDICGIPAATLRAVARLYATSEASIIFWAWASRSTSTAPTTPAA